MELDKVRQTRMSCKLEMGVGDKMDSTGDDDIPPPILYCRTDTLSYGVV